MSTTTASATPGVGQALRGAAKAAGATAALAAGANLVVYASGRTLGVDFAVAPPQGPGLTIGVGLVVLTSVVPLLLGGIALALASHWGATGWRALAWAGLAIGVLSVVMPLTVEATAGTKATLALMHVLTGVAWFVVVRRSARSRAADR